MTAIRTTIEHKTILDFSDSRNSHNYVMNKLRSAEFLEFKSSRKGVRTYLNYNIKVGIYTIFVDLFHTQSCAKKLKDYETFCIRVSEGNKEINITRDDRFSSESWVKINKKLSLNTSNLAEAIVFCSRLNSLKCFL